MPRARVLPDIILPMLLERKIIDSYAITIVQCIHRESLISRQHTCACQKHAGLATPDENEKQCNLNRLVPECNESNSRDVTDTS